MKRLTYLLALGALLVLGTGCDKESATDNTPVPLYVNSWVVTDSSGDGPQNSVFCFNADKTFYLGYIVNEAMLKKIQDDIKPSTDGDAPTIDGDGTGTGEKSRFTAEQIEILKSLKVNDIAIIIKGVYVEIPGENDDVYLSTFFLQNIDGMDRAEYLRNELHIFNISENEATFENKEGGMKETKVLSLAASGLTVGKAVECSFLFIS
mgnify:CR=1 FL=1